MKSSYIYTMIRNRDLPKTYENMKKAIFIAAIIALISAGCGKVENPDGGATSHITRLSGKIAGTIDDQGTRISGVVDDDLWVLAGKTGPFTIKVKVYGIAGTPPATVASGPLAEDGTFSVELPATVDEGLLIDPGYSDQTGIVMSDTGLRTCPPQQTMLYIYDGADHNIGTVGYYSPDTARGDLLYADRDCTVRGTISFTPEGEEAVFTDTYDYNLRRGWNWIFIYDDERPDFTIRTKIPSDARYYMSGWIE
uniref:Uncharacterized protein n=2 Tax=termite gut metagenome TaxID=433724 RepID=S0DFM4_9ZZZZ